MALGITDHSKGRAPGKAKGEKERLCSAPYAESLIYIILTTLQEKAVRWAICSTFEAGGLRLREIKQPANVTLLVAKVGLQRPCCHCPMPSWSDQRREDRTGTGGWGGAGGGRLEAQRWAGPAASPFRPMHTAVSSSLKVQP